MKSQIWIAPDFDQMSEEELKERLGRELSAWAGLFLALLAGRGRGEGLVLRRKRMIHHPRADAEACKGRHR
jgi:hypothetical protein